MLSFLVFTLAAFASLNALPTENFYETATSPETATNPEVVVSNEICLQGTCITADDLKALIALKKSITVNVNGKVGSLAVDSLTLGKGKWQAASENEVFVIRDLKAAKDSRYALYPGRYIDL